ncbi:MAG TPA: DNA methyltransferase [Woeseiaceae bacterium]|nr:DNA methyltransferase [Woeseiaceae bacterium]
MKAIRQTKDGRIAELVRQEVPDRECENARRSIDDLVVVAEFRDPIYPGLTSTGKVERGGSKPFHTVVNAENFHALQALLYTHEGKVDAIYIDPPYNTGARDWKYNNDYVDSDDSYRHSKWLAMMERRLKLAKRLLNPDDSVLIVTIDEKEYLRLGLLLEQVFTEATIQMVSSQINPAAIARAGQFGRSDEYLYFVLLGSSAPGRILLDREWVSAKGRTHTGKVRWDMLRRSGTNAERSHSPGCFYPIYVDPNGPRVHSIGRPLPENRHEAEEREGAVAVLPIRQNGTEGNWQWSPETFESRLEQGRVRITGNLERGFVVSILKDGEFAKIQNGEFEVTGHAADGSIEVAQRDASRVFATPGTQWRIASHDATQYGTRLLSAFIPDRKFPFPKSLYAVEDALRFFVHNKPDATVVDFFAGSGTTAHAVMRLNREDEGRRQSISITNNEVSADDSKRLKKENVRSGDAAWEKLGICEYFTKPRIIAAVTGKTLSGEPIKGDYRFSSEFPMKEGLEENVEFFTMTYEAPRPVAHNRSFQAIAPLLWLKAGAQGRRIEVPTDDFDISDTYGVLFDLDQSHDFIEAIGRSDTIGIAFLVTDDDRAYQAVCAELPTQVEPVRLYESYLTSFTINTGKE